MSQVDLMVLIVVELAMNSRLMPGSGRAPPRIGRINSRPDFEARKTRPMDGGGALSRAGRVERSIQWLRGHANCSGADSACG